MYRTVHSTQQQGVICRTRTHHAVPMYLLSPSFVFSGRHPSAYSVLARAKTPGTSGPCEFENPTPEENPTVPTALLPENRARHQTRAAVRQPRPASTQPTLHAVSYKQFRPLKRTLQYLVRCFLKTKPTTRHKQQNSRPGRPRHNLHYM